MAKAKSSARRKKKPAPCNAHKQAGDAYYLGNQFEQAIAEYSAALEDPLLESVLRATILSNRSAAHLKLSQPEFALIDADLSLLHNPGWHKAHLRRARALESLVMLEQAAEAYASAGKLDEAAEVERIHERSLVGASDDTDRYTVMANWLRAGGSRFDKLYLEYYGEEYRGVHSLVPIPKDEILLKVPLDCIMTTDVAKASTIGQAIQASGCKLMSTHSWLAAFLLQEKHAPESDWKEYIDILPKAYRSMPIFFNETELSYLKGSFSLEKISDRKETLDREFRNICRHIPAFAEYTYEGFVWARLVVITRIFGFYIKGRKTEGLVGMADMLNHQIPSEKDVKWSFSDEHNGFIMTSTKEIARGVQIYDSYGRKCNHRFFVNYGFSLESNPDNEAMFCVGIPDGDPEYERKQALLGGFDMDAYEELQAPANLAHASCRLFIGYLRIAHARGQDLDRVPKSLDEVSFHVQLVD